MLEETLEKRETNSQVIKSSLRQMYKVAKKHKIKVITLNSIILTIEIPIKAPIREFDGFKLGPLKKGKWKVAPEKEYNKILGDAIVKKIEELEPFLREIIFLFESNVNQAKYSEER